MGEQEKNATVDSETAADFELSETWAEDAQHDLEEWIELQGIHIRQ